MKRRTFISGITFGILAAPLAAEAQQGRKVLRLGVLAAAPEPRYIEAFRAGLRENGYVEGQNVILEFRYSQGRNELFPSLAAELVDLRMDVIAAATTPAARAARSATNTIPIVFV